MSRKTEALLLACLSLALASGLVVFSCMRDATAHRPLPAITVPLHP